MTTFATQKVTLSTRARNSEASISLMNILDQQTLLDVDSCIYVAGHRGMVGSAIVRRLNDRGYHNILTRDRSELDLCNQADVRQFFEDEKIDHVVMAAAKVGGIHANNSYPAEFIYQNLMVESNIIHESWRTGVNRLLFLGSSCIYPRDAAQPMKESELLTGALESTNEPYAVAKIAGIKLCESYNRQYGTDYRSIMPTNLYGPQDNFHPDNSHVIPALMRRIHEAKEKGDESVLIWGTGNARREFLHVNDMAAACVHLMELSKEECEKHTKPMLSHINVGTGNDLTIRELAEAIKQVVSFKGSLRFDTGKPDGTPRKLLDVSKINQLGWKPEMSLMDGLKDTYDWFLDHQSEYRY